MSPFLSAFLAYYGDYYAGGRKFNKFYLMMHALGTASHADEPVSVIGGAYEKDG